VRRRHLKIGQRTRGEEMPARRGDQACPPRANLVSPKRIAGVNTDPHDIPGLNALEVEGLQGFVRNMRTAVSSRRGPCEDEQPSRRDHTDANER